MHTLRAVNRFFNQGCVALSFLILTPVIVLGGNAAVLIAGQAQDLDTEALVQGEPGSGTLTILVRDAFGQPLPQVHLMLYRLTEGSV